jgi:putative ABC transport system permease protein
MRLYQVVARDILRRRRRLLYTALGVVIGVATFTAMLTIARAGEAKIYSELDKYGPNMMVTPAVSDMSLQLGDLTLGTLAIGDNYIPEDRVIEVRGITDGAIREALGITDEGDIATIAPKLYVNTDVGGTSVMVVGFDPQQERQLRTWWTVSGGEYPDLQSEALVGARASEALHIKVGDTVPIGTQQVTAAGVLGETGSNDDYQIFVPLQTVQKAFGKEGLVSSIDIRALCSACPVESISDRINASIPGVRAVAVLQIAQTEMNLMERVNRFLLALAGVTLVVGSLGVANTMMSSVQERLKDIGIMKAVGASPTQLVRMFMYEALAVGLVGGILGYVAGTLLSYVVGPLVFNGLAVRYVPAYFPAALGIAVAVAAAASVYPALRASKVKVAKALRSL